MTQPIVWYQTFLDWLEKAIYVITVALAALLFLNTSMGIIWDQFIGNSIVWIEEINNLLFTWLIFLGAGVVARYGGHIGVDMVFEILPAQLQNIVRVIYMILALIVVWVMVFYGMRLALFVGQYQASIYLRISLFYYYLSVPAGGVLLGLFSIGVALPDPRPGRRSAETDGA